MVADLSENGRDNRNQNSGDALDLEEGAERMDIEENPRYASALPVVFPATALRDSDTRPPVTLEKIIEFGKELYELEKSLKDPDGKYKQMLFVSNRRRNSLKQKPKGSTNDYSYISFANLVYYWRVLISIHLYVQKEDFVVK